jgi:hypothetical protein
VVPLARHSYCRRHRESFMPNSRALTKALVLFLCISSIHAIGTFGSIANLISLRGGSASSSIVDRHLDTISDRVFNAHAAAPVQNRPKQNGELLASSVNNRPPEGPPRLDGDTGLDVESYSTVIGACATSAISSEVVEQVSLGLKIMLETGLSCDSAAYSALLKTCSQATGGNSNIIFCIRNAPLLPSRWHIWPTATTHKDITVFVARIQNTFFFARCEAET